MPFRSDNDAPWWVRENVPDEVLDPQRDLQVPGWLLDAPHTAARLDADTLVPCECEHCGPWGTDTTNAGAVPKSIAGPLAEEFRLAWTAAQQQTAAAWRIAAAMHAKELAVRGPAAAEHVGADLALLMNVHPRTGEVLLVTALGACQEVPGLVELVASGALGVKHVDALQDEAGKWTDTSERAAAVIALTLARCRDRVERYGWPTPTELRRRVRATAILLDLQVMTKRKKTVAEGRGVALSQTGIGKAALTLEGPELMVLQAYRAIEARAEAMGRLPGDTRTQQQRLHDAALELLCVDADGGVSAVPATGADGQPVVITVRGGQIAVLTPYSVLQGGDHELAEIPGYGPILPATARELARDAESFRRVAIDAETGHVIAVDDAIPGPARTAAATDAASATDPKLPGEDLREQVDGPEDEDDDPGDGPGDGSGDGPGGGAPGDDPPPPQAGPSEMAMDALVDSGCETDDAVTWSEKLYETHAEAARQARRATRGELRRLLESIGTDDPPGTVEPDDPPEPSPLLDPTTVALLQRLVSLPVIHRDLSSRHYRVPGRLRRHIELRDRTCTFPHCTVPGRVCDVDHREPWPLGPTDRENCHCLCRRHHRAKQAYFHVTLDTTTGDTLWTAPDGRTYRRPPPHF